MGGLVGGMLYQATTKLMLILKLDDGGDSFAIHGVCGMWGCVGCAMFAPMSLLRRVFPHIVDDQASRLWASSIAAASFGGWGFMIALLLLQALAAMGLLRVQPEAETWKVDLTQKERPRPPSWK